MNGKGFLTANQIIFAYSIIDYMREHHDVDNSIGVRITFKHIRDIDVEDATAQHLGADYFALQIMMAEGIIPYRPM